MRKMGLTLAFLCCGAVACSPANQAPPEPQAEPEPPEINLARLQGLDGTHTQPFGLSPTSCSDSQIVDALWRVILSTRNPKGDFQLDHSWVQPVELPKMNGRIVSLQFSWSPGDPGVRMSAIDTSLVDEECETISVDYETLK